MSLRINSIGTIPRYNINRNNNVNFSGKCQVGKDEDMKKLAADSIVWTSGTSLYIAEDKALLLGRASQKIAQESPDEDNYYFRYFRYSRDDEDEFDKKVLQLYRINPNPEQDDILIVQSMTERENGHNDTRKFKRDVEALTDIALDRIEEGKTEPEEDLYEICPYMPLPADTEKPVQISEHLQKLFKKEYVERADF